MKTGALVLCLALATVCAHGADGGKAVTTQDAYKRAQELRDRANLITNSPVPNPRDLESAVGYLNEALDFLATPEVYERGVGDLFLKARRADVLRDLAGAYALTGRREEALWQLELMEQESWSPGVAKWLREDKRLASIQDEPRFKAVLATLESPDRFWKVPNIATSYREKLPVEERIAGLSLFWAEARSTFVYFDHAPGVQWDRVYLDYLPRVMAAETTADYYRVMMQLAPLLQDSHTNIYPPKELQDKFYSRPPLRTEAIGDKVYVTAVRSATLGKRVHVGDEIVAIDGMPVMRYGHEKVDPFVSSSTPQDRGVRDFDYQLLAGDAAQPVRLTLRDASSGSRDETLARTGYDDVAYPPQVEYHKIGDVAYISIDQFESNAGMKALEKSLPEIMASKGLVLDLRHNGGGSTQYGLQILSYLVADPLPKAKQSIRGETAFFRSASGGPVFWMPAPGSNYSFNFNRKEHFAGPVAVLIGPETFSAAEDFVMMFDASKRGILVGATTAGSTGQPMSFALPGGGTARICIKRDTYPDGHEFVGKGIAPNIAVAMTAEDLRAGKDPVLDRAVAELSKPR
jgi:C-terminal processing protease CtpA/Prc